jgi:hypothetical protein
MQIGGIAFLKPAVRQTLLLGTPVPGLDEVLRDIDAQHIRSGSRLRQCRRSVAASEIQNLEPFCDSESLDERFSALSHTRRNAGKVAFFPKCFVRIHGNGPSPLFLFVLVCFWPPPRATANTMATASGRRIVAAEMSVAKGAKRPRTQYVDRQVGKMPLPLPLLSDHRAR